MHLNQQPYAVKIILPISQMKKLRLGSINALNKQGGADWNAGIDSYSSGPSSSPGTVLSSYTTKLCTSSEKAMQCLRLRPSHADAASPQCGCTGDRGREWPKSSSGPRSPSTQWEENHEAKHNSEHQWLWKSVTLFPFCENILELTQTVLLPSPTI